MTNMEPHKESKTGLDIAAEIQNPALWLAMIMVRPTDRRFKTVGEAMDYVEGLARHAIARALESASSAKSVESLKGEDDEA